MECCTPKCMAVKMLVLGLVLVLVRLYTAWDIWIVLGAILIIKAVVMFVMPTCKCNVDTKKKKK